MSLLRPLRRLWRRSMRKKAVRTGLAVAVLAVVAGVVIYKQTMPSTINPSAYAPLLDTIAKGESHGNYNAYFGSVDNSAIRFTDMSVADVLQWQQEYVNQGSRSSAVGKYQIVRSTLAGLVQQLGIDTQVRFDPALQDQLAITLLERRGVLAYMQKQLTREEFAANLAKEWAALPRVMGGNPEESYYAKDGLNKSLIGVDEMYEAIAALEHNAAAL